RTWSAAPTRSLTVPPGRVATIQSNFLFQRCGRLAGGHSVAVPGALVLRYRTAGGVRERLIPVPSQAFSLVAGPTRRACAPVAGSTDVFSSNTSCAATRKAALACHPLSHGSWGDCTSDNILWNCGRVQKRVELCWQGPQKLRSHWFRVRWNKFL